MQQLTPEQRKQARSALKVEIKNELRAEVYGTYVTIADLKLMLDRIAKLEAEVTRLKGNSIPAHSTSNPPTTRTQIIEALLTGEKSVGDLMEITKKSYSTIASVVCALKTEGLVVARSTYDQTFDRRLKYFLSPKYFCQEN